MNINFSFTEDQVCQLISESYEFRRHVAHLLIDQQTALNKLNGEYPGEKFAILNLEDYVKRNFNFENRIPAIKFVRQWAVDNKEIISPTTYNELFSLAGAKGWVDKRIVVG